MANAKFMALALAGTLVASTAISTASASGNKLAPQEDYTVAQEAKEVEPAAVPAVVGTALLTGAATAAGAKVGDWVADKIIGIWSVDETIENESELEVIFN